MNRVNLFAGRSVGLVSASRPPRPLNLIFVPGRSAKSDEVDDHGIRIRDYWAGASGTSIQSRHRALSDAERFGAADRLLCWLNIQSAQTRQANAYVSRRQVIARNAHSD